MLKSYFITKYSQIALLVTCVLATTGVFAQNSRAPKPEPTPPAEDEAVVKITTTLVQIDATVVDKNGKIVNALTADDFEIYENGKKQQITNFSFIEPQSSAAPDSTNVKSSKNSISAPPFSRNLRPEQVRRTIALVVDDLGLSFASINAVKSSLKKFVEEQMQPDDLVTVVKTSAGNGVLQQFTSDKRILRAAIERIRWYPLGRADVSAFKPVYPNDTRLGGSTTPNPIDGDRAVDEIRQQSFTIGTLGAINYVIRGMSALPGRKAVLLFSDGFKLSDTVINSDGAEANGAIGARISGVFQRLTDLANRASVVIYGIDARGVLAPLTNADDYARSGVADKFSANEGREAGEIAAERTKILFDTQQGLKYLSEQTGGFAVTNNNNLVKGVERVLNDQKGYYLLGYQPDDSAFDPRTARFNKLTVKLKRPDLRVRYRSGFYGIADKEAKPVPSTPQQQILAALTTPFNASDIDLRLTSLYANDQQTGDFMRSLLYVNGKDLTFTEDADGWEKATFDIVAVTVADNGNVVDQVSRIETIKARSDTLREIREKGFVATITVPIKKPGAYQLRVMMRDAKTGEIGSANQFVEVPNLKKDRLALSGILLQRAGKLKESEQTRQFQPDEQRDLAARSFRAGTDVRFGYAIYNARLDKATNAPALSMQFKIFRDGKEIFVSPEKAVALTDQTDLRRLVGEGVFALGKNAASGDFVLQIIVKDLAAKENDRIAVQWIDFQIVD